MLNYGSSSVNAITTENAWPKSKVSNFTVGSDDSFDFRVMFAIWDIDNIGLKRDQDKIGKLNVELNQNKWDGLKYEYTSINLKTRPCDLND